jgi:hypothetical protein
MIDVAGAGNVLITLSGAPVLDPTEVYKSTGWVILKNRKLDFLFTASSEVNKLQHLHQVQ